MRWPGTAEDSPVLQQGIEAFGLKNLGTRLCLLLGDSKIKFITL